MITERRQLRKAIQSILEDSNPEKVERLADKVLEIIEDTRPRHKYSGEDAIALFRKVTGIVMIPPARADKDIEIITAMMREYGEQETEQRMRTAWTWWGTCRGKDGRPYHRTNTAWIDFALSGELSHMPTGSSTKERDGGMYV